jgi:hypothetical protein
MPTLGRRASPGFLAAGSHLIRAETESQYVAPRAGPGSGRARRSGGYHHFPCARPPPGVTLGAGRRTERERCARRKAYQPVARPGTGSPGNSARAARVMSTPIRTPSAATRVSRARLPKSRYRWRSDAGPTAQMTTTPSTGRRRPTRRRRESTASRTKARTGPRSPGGRSASGGSGRCRGLVAPLVRARRIASLRRRPASAGRRVGPRPLAER